MRAGLAVLALAGAVALRAEDPAVSTAAPSAVGPEDVASGPVAAGDLAQGSPAEESEVRPPWLLRAERAFQEGAEAEARGDVRAARRKYARALKIFADGTDDATLLDLRPEIATLLDLARDVPFPRPGDCPPVEEVRPVTAEELRSVQPADLSPAVSTRSYAIHIDRDDPLVQRYIALYTGPLRARTQEAFDRMARYEDMVVQAIRETGMPQELIYLPVVESEYQPFAVSRAGAVGMWQFMPATARYAGLKINYWVDERRDPVKSTRAALETLKSLYEWFDDWHLALAAYNRGLYGIQRDLEFTRSPDFTLLARRQGVPMETEQYVPKLMALVLIGDNREEYGFRASGQGGHPPPDEVVLDRPLDLKVAAACAKTTEEVIRELNPSLRLWCTPRNEASFAFKIPAGSKERFQAELAKIKDWTPSPGYVKYTVRQGDVLGRIANRYRTTSAAIQRENRLANPNRLRPGQVLVIRPGRGFKGE